MFYGINEGKDENCNIMLAQFFTDELGMTGEIDLARAHRMGKATPGKTRPIVAKFKRFQQRVKVRAAGPRLTGKRFGVFEQIPKEWQEKRKPLLPHFKDGGSCIGTIINCESYNADDPQLIINEVNVNMSTDIIIISMLNVCSFSTKLDLPDFIIFIESQTINCFIETKMSSDKENLIALLLIEVAHIGIRGPNLRDVVTDYFTHDSQTVRFFCV